MTRHKTEKKSASASPVTCKVLCLEVQVAQLVDVADVHVLLVDLGFVEILGWNHKEHQITRVEIFKRELFEGRRSRASHHEVDGAADFLGFHLVSFHTVPAKGV